MVASNTVMVYVCHHAIGTSESKGMYDSINIPGAIYVCQNPVSVRTKD